METRKNRLGGNLVSHPSLQASDQSNMAASSKGERLANLRERQMQTFKAKTDENPLNTISIVYFL